MLTLALCIIKGYKVTEKEFVILMTCWKFDQERMKPGGSAFQDYFQKHLDIAGYASNLYNIMIDDNFDTIPFYKLRDHALLCNP